MQRQLVERAWYQDDQVDPVCIEYVTQVFGQAGESVVFPNELAMLNDMAARVAAPEVIAQDLERSVKWGVAKRLKFADGPTHTVCSAAQNCRARRSMLMAVWP